MAKDPYNFQCKMCGNCCRGEGYVYINHREIREMARELGMNFLDFELKYVVQYNNSKVLRSKENEDCILLEDSLCKVHDAKPEQCKKWPFWPEIFKVREVFEEAKSYCEGLKEFDFEDFHECSIQPYKISYFQI